MKEYRIVKIKDQYLPLIYKYPDLARQLYQQPYDLFTSKQIDLVFESIEQAKKQLLDIFHQRSDYCYFHGIHNLCNELTGEKIEITFNEYDIKVLESSHHQVIFAMIQSLSKNYYVIENNDFANI